MFFKTMCLLLLRLLKPMLTTGKKKQSLIKVLSWKNWMMLPSSGHSKAERVRLQNAKEKRLPKYKMGLSRKHLKIWLHHESHTIYIR